MALARRRHTTAKNRDGAAGLEPGLAPLSAEERAIVDEEERLAARVREALAEAARVEARRRAGADDLATLRGEIDTAQEADVPSVLGQLHVLRSTTDAAGDRSLPDPAEPYFAHLRVDLGHRVRDVLVGYRTFIDAARRITIVDWQTSPMARVFYTCREGDGFEEELRATGAKAGGELETVEGVVAARRVVSFDASGALRRVATPAAVFARARGGPARWARESFEGLGAGGATLGTGQAEAGSGGPPVTALLDREQHGLLQRAGEGPLLILGGAGCGKTTVALHRMSMLHAVAPERYGQRDMLVVVPTAGLARLSTILLEQLGLGEVEVTTFDDWVVKQARAVLRRAAARPINREAPPRVIALKRHPALREVLRGYVEGLEAEVAGRLDRRLGARGEVATLFDRRSQARGPSHLKSRLASARRRLAAELPRTQIPAVEVDRAFRDEHKKLVDVWADHVRVMGDERLLTKAAALSGGAVPASTVAEACLHLRRQLAAPAEVEYAHVDADRLRALDGRPLDEGTPEEVAGTVDVEDLALLFELLWLKTGAARTPAGPLATYGHIVIDEAQELAPVELALLARSLRPGGAMTVAGDEAQQLDPTAAFASWPDTLAALGLGDAEVARLTTTYRCTREITRFGWDVLGPVALAAPPNAPKAGAPVAFWPSDGEGPQALWLLEAFEGLLDREPGARAAVIAHDRRTAARLHAVLSERFAARLVLDGQFSLRPGVDVTEVAQVKGLEFDYVVIPDASAADYPDTPAARRELFVASTRAIHQLWVAWTREPSPAIAWPRRG